MFCPPAKGLINITHFKVDPGSPCYQNSPHLVLKNLRLLTISQWEYRLFSQQPSLLSGLFRPPLWILKTLSICLPSIIQQLRLKLAISLLISVFSVWNRKGLENQTKNAVHVKPTFYNWDIAPILESFILKLLKAHLAPKGLNIYSNCFTVGSIHQSVVEKTFPGFVAGKQFCQVEMLSVSFFILVHPSPTTQ